jgi:ABC-2 type transport system ATP-binding protein
MRPPIAGDPRTFRAYLEKFFLEQNRDCPVQISAQDTHPRPFIALQHFARRMAEAVAMQRIEALLHYWGLEHDAQHKMVGFSKGMRQKVLISAAIIHNPMVLLMDEPLNGLDAEAGLLLRSLLRAWAATGRTVLYSSHILDAVEKVADRVIVIRGGRIIGDGTSQQLKALTAAASLEGAFSQLTATEDVTVRTQALLGSAFAEGVAE